jgi:hypothetical protein
MYKKNLNITNGTIPLSEAVARTNRWQTAHPNEPKAFSFKMEELDALIATIKSNKTGNMLSAVRFYLGLDKNAIPSLMMVAVVGEFDPELDQAGRDILGDPDDAEISYVYDFSNPCPYLCDESSAMYKGKI